MTFKALYWENPSLFQENLLNMAYNLFKIQYFYEEDQLPKISQLITEPQIQTTLLQSYQEAADEAKVYLKTIQAFRLKRAKLPDEQEYFNYLLEYFMLKDKELSAFELNEERFMKWMENGEYATDITELS